MHALHTATSTIRAIRARPPRRAGDSARPTTMPVVAHAKTARQVGLPRTDSSPRPVAMANTTQTPSPDQTLVARLSAGDERALGELYDRYGGMAYSLACAIV